MLNVDALNRADTRREIEDLWLTEAFSRVEAPLLFPNQRWVEAFFDRCPNRKGRRKVIAIDRKVGTIADSDFVDRVEEMIGGVSSKNVGEAWLNAHCDDRQQTLLAPGFVSSKLRRTKRNSDLVVRVGRMRLAEVHRHIEIIRTCGETCIEDWFVQTRVACVHDNVGVALSDQSNNVGFVSSIDARGVEPPRIIEFIDRTLCRLNRNIGKRER
ncbi:unannotated protein [freshwater metagenome]|uniref:Unannotated protein n=1 Tax=freshwater metagenome TaxID=449393 RepID=A0A6J6GWS2_9ZZZZ